MQTISYSIKVGSEQFESGQSQALLDLRTHASFAEPVHVCTFRLAATQAFDIEPQALVEVKLGDRSDLQRVFTGHAHHCSQGPKDFTITAFSSFSALVGHAFNLVFEQAIAGDVVKDLLDRLEVTSSKIENGLKFPFYRMSEQRNVYDHLKELARLCNFDFYANVKDKAHFKPYTPETFFSLKYDRDVLFYSKSSTPSKIDGTHVFGESPTSQQGDKASTWLSKNPPQGKSGESSGRILHLSQTTATSDAITQQIADNLYNSYQYKSIGKLHVIGSPKVKLAGTISTEAFPDSALNGLRKVIAVSHHLNFKTGFITQLEYQEI